MPARSGATAGHEVLEPSMSFDPTENAMERYPLPESINDSPDAIARWIDSVVPCVPGPQSPAVTRAVLKYLRRDRVRGSVVAGAMAKSTYNFTFETVKRREF